MSTSPGPVLATFRDSGGFVIGSVGVDAQGQVTQEGDLSWLDFAFTPADPAGRPLHFQQDPAAWVRALPAAYAAVPQISVELSEPRPAPAPAATPAPGGGRTRAAAGAPRWHFDPLEVGLYAALAVAVAAAVGTGGRGTGAIAAWALLAVLAGGGCWWLQTRLQRSTPAGVLAAAALLASEALAALLGRGHMSGWALALLGLFATLAAMGFWQSYPQLMLPLLLNLQYLVVQVSIQVGSAALQMQTGIAGGSGGGFAASPGLGSSSGASGVGSIDLTSPGQLALVAGLIAASAAIGLLLSGALLVAAGWWLDEQGLRGHAFWPHLFGVTSLALGAAGQFGLGGQGGWKVLLPLGAALLFGAVRLQRGLYVFFAVPATVAGLLSLSQAGSSAPWLLLAVGAGGLAGAGKLLADRDG